MQSATATARQHTNLFQPGVDVTKSCSPDPITVGAVETCVIGISNTSSADSPDLSNGTISRHVDWQPARRRQHGSCVQRLHDDACGGCELHDHHDPYGVGGRSQPVGEHGDRALPPVGFPNDITDSASDSVVIETSGGQGCTPGFWKQSQHFQFWVGFSPNQTFSSVFGVTITVNTGGKTTVTDPTLLQALSANGGGFNAFARFSVNALLASSSLSSPDFTTAQVIALVQAAVAPGDPTVAQVTQQFSSASGVVNDNCTGFVTPG